MSITLIWAIVATLVAAAAIAVAVYRDHAAREAKALLDAGKDAVTGAADRAASAVRRL